MCVWHQITILFMKCCEKGKVLANSVGGIQQPASFRCSIWQLFELSQFKQVLVTKQQEMEIIWVEKNLCHINGLILNGSVHCFENYLKSKTQSVSYEKQECMITRKHRYSRPSPPLLKHVEIDTKRKSKGVWN